MRNVKKIVLVFLTVLCFASVLIGCGGKKEAESSEMNTVPTHIQSICRVLTKRFVENLIEEEYSMLAFNVVGFELDENEDGKVEILYLPSNAGEEGATKLNLTIAKNGNTYTVEYAMLAGLYEVDLSQVPEEEITFVD